MHACGSGCRKAVAMRVSGSSEWRATLQVQCRQDDVDAGMRWRHGARPCMWWGAKGRDMHAVEGGRDTRMRWQSMGGGRVGQSTGRGRARGEADMWSAEVRGRTSHSCREVVRQSLPCLPDEAVRQHRQGAVRFVALLRPDVLAPEQNRSHTHGRRHAAKCGRDSNKQGRGEAV